jgi:3-hydroxybutyryl-CoA dehydrogenase
MRLNLMKIEDIKKVLIVGAGTMGQQIGALCAIHGFTVDIYDINEQALDSADKRINDILRYFVKSNRITAKEADKAKSRIRRTMRIREGAANADIVSESVPEDPALKEKVFSQIDTLCPDHTIFTTNTSVLVPSMFADGTGRPDRLVALHFHDVRATNIVDVMVHPGTSDETFNLVCDFAKQLGQVPIVLKKESPGYVFNFMLTALFQAAQTLAEKGVTSIEEIDRAWMGVTHMSVGPFGLMDSIGLETVWKVTDYWAHKLDDQQYKQNAEYLKRYVDNGHLGRKSGQGFYRYPKPAYLEPGFVNGKVK